MEPVPPNTACPFCQKIMAPYDKDRKKAFNLWYHGDCHVQAVKKENATVLGWWKSLRK